MADVVDKATRSRMMAGIRGKDTTPELLLRQALHAKGFRFRLHDRNLPGRPDIFLRRYNAAIFVHGCFWHRHRGCRYASTPATRPDFWQTKFAQNVERDERNVADLLAAGARVAVVWECSLAATRRGQTFDAVASWMNSDGRLLTIN
jgi:DNA mismatch endonuclease, patch repair protein